MSVGRNDLCPCGSGRKYKRCHYAIDSAATAQSVGVPSPIHRIDERVVDDIVAYLGKRFPDEAADEAAALLTHPNMSPQFRMPWLAYVAEFERRAAVDWYLEEQGWALSAGTREWLEAQQKAWLSVWEVIDFEPGRTLTLRDSLTAEERTVHEVSASKNAKRHMLVLARIVDSAGVSLICGMHTVPLPPAAGAGVVERMRKTLRRRTAVSPDRLRSARIAWRMLDAWSDAVDRRLAPPILQNTDGDPILFVEDRWPFRAADRPDVMARLASIEGAERESGDKEAFTFVRAGNPIHKHWYNTIVGRAVLSTDSLVAEVNSVARADSLRDVIEQACGELLGNRLRSISDPSAVLEQQRQTREPAASASKVNANTPEMNEIAREMKERHYAEWIHQCIPALGGKTPREAAKTKRGREMLDALMKDIELIEGNQPEAVRFNVRKLRRALGLPV